MVYRKSSVINRSCPNPECEFHGQSKKHNIIKYGYFNRIHHSRSLFDEVCMLSVEGVNKSAIARIKHLSWNTVSRWLERACIAAKRFNRGMLKGFTLREPQADEIRTFITTKSQLDNALERSEDSSTLNTSFVDRHNLTIRCGSAYLHRLSPSHARRPEYLKDHLELLQCHYNFIRPHSALKYGNEIWTPAMQAGLASKRLTIRQVFLATIASSIFVFI
jgi:hypothetical protein